MEDTLLILAHSKYGNSWKHISKLLPGRRSAYMPSYASSASQRPLYMHLPGSENEIKNRFSSVEMKRKMESKTSRGSVLTSSPMHKKSKHSTYHSSSRSGMIMVHDGRW